MPCVCHQCLQHSELLGLSGGSHSRAEIQRAYRKAAKRWHPDRFENAPGLRPEAEENFKRLQVAYRELSEHDDHPAELPAQTIFAKPVPPPPFSFGEARGCFTAPHFPAHVERIIADHLGPDHAALAIVDLARTGWLAGGFSQFLILASHAVMVRNQFKIVALLWYTELGDIFLTDRRHNGKLSFWQQLAEKFTGPQPNYSLQIFRRNGGLFCNLSVETDDSAKKVIYNFLLRKKHETHP